ncbi:MAG TPA: FAD-dependent oxidoreductase [Pirellulaceae bacterium]
MLADEGHAGALPARPVVVCGAGAAGTAAALAAARSGVAVLLIETAPNLGGTVANVLIHTIGGLFDSSGDFINDGLPRELVERLQAADSRTGRRKMGRLVVLQVCPNVYRHTLERWIGDEPQITMLLGATIGSVRQSDGQITELSVKFREQHFSVQPRAVVDATGTAAVARLLSSSHVIDDQQRAGGGLIFRLRNASPGALQFPKGVGVVSAIRAAADAGALPSACRHAWLDAGIDPDEAFVKLLVPLPSGALSAAGQNDEYQTALATQAALVNFLKQLPDFRDAVVTQTGSLGIRDGGRIAGRYTLTGDDVRAGRTFADGICRCAWPIEYWDSIRGVSIEYLPAGAAYEIPMRCLQLMGVENYWTAGKCLSADRHAHASARVAGACWAMGQAAGRAAALCQEHEEIGAHESLRPVSRYGATAAESSRGNHDSARHRSVVP